MLNKSVLISLYFSIALPSYATPPKRCKELLIQKDIQTIQLSNGLSFPIPSTADNFSLISLVGNLEFNSTLKLLKKENLYPIKIGDSGVGMLSSFHYKKTFPDWGEFSEVYFVILASRKPIDNTYQSIVELLKNFRYFKSSPNSNVVFYHLHTFSNHSVWQLVSEEAWGIPSELMDVEFSMTEKSKSFTLSKQGVKLLHVKARNYFGLPSYLGADMAVLTAGPQIGTSEPRYSPVISCGKTFLGISHKKSQLTYEVDTHGYAFELGETLRHLKFKPTLIQWGEDLTAIQF